MTPEKLQAEFARSDDREIAEAVRAMMAHSATRRFLWFILSQGNAFGSPNPFSVDHASTAFNCGIMSVGQAVLAKITDVDPEIPLTLLKEMLDERNDRDKRLRDAAGNDDPIDPTETGRGDFYRGDDRERERTRRRVLDGDE